MNVQPYQLNAVDQACEKMLGLKALRVMVGHFTGRFWSVLFFVIAISSFLLAFQFAPLADLGQTRPLILTLACLVHGLSFTVCSHVFGTTDHLQDRSFSKLAIKIFFACLCSTLTVALVVSLVTFQPIGRYVLFTAMCGTALLSFFLRSALWRFSASYRPVINLIGDREFCEESANYLRSQALPLAIHTLSLSESDKQDVFIHDFDTSGYPVSLRRLAHWIEQDKADQIVYQPARWDMLEDSLVGALSEGKSVSTYWQYIEARYQKMPTWEIPNSALFSQSFANCSPAYLIAKRCVDLLFSTFGLIASAPLVILAALAIKMEDGGPVFYKQTRVGRFSKNFSIYKLRSMCTDSETHGAKWASKGDSRVTRVGKILRRTRIDELPQFVNILRGDMSFIGPRPERPEFTESLEKDLNHYKLRHLLKPGLTGWAQINYPYGDSIEDAEQKLTYDLYYVKHANIALDMQITLRTIGAAMQGAR